MLSIVVRPKAHRLCPETVSGVPPCSGEPRGTAPIFVVASSENLMRTIVREFEGLDADELALRDPTGVLRRGATALCKARC